MTSSDGPPPLASLDGAQIAHASPGGLDRNLYALLLDCFPADRERRIAVIRSDQSRLSYAYLDETTARMAAVLEKYGADPGERVAVQVEKSAEALCLYLACLRCGAVFLPLNPAYTRDEVAYFVEDARPRLFICDPARADSIADLLQFQPEIGILTLDEDGFGSLSAKAATHSGDFPTVPRRGDDPAAIVYTSGTTGRAKGAVLSHRNLAINALALCEIWGFKGDDVLLHALPLYHVHGLFVAVHTALLRGAAILLLDRFHPTDVLRALPEATVMMGVPTYYVRLLEQPDLTPERVQRMRLFISGSAPLSEKTFRAFEDRTGHRILERYGMTETGMNTSNPLDGERRAGTVGLPLPGVTIRIADADGNPVQAGTVGMIEVRGLNVFKEYWEKPNRTAESFRPDGFFITGDLGMVSADGYVSIVGRAKDLIITGGLNVYPKEVERVLDALPEVTESAVFGVPDADYGERIVAAVVPAAGTRPDTETLRQSAAERLAGYKVPKRIDLFDALPRNSMGKVQKTVLRDRYRP